MALNPLLFRDPFTEDVCGLYFYSLDMLKRNVGKTREDIIVELSKQLGVECPSNSSESHQKVILSDVVVNGSQSVSSTSDIVPVASLQRRETPLPYRRSFDSPTLEQEVRSARERVLDALSRLEDCEVGAGGK